MDCIGFNYLVMINYSLDLLSSAKIVNLPELTKHFSENFEYEEVLGGASRKKFRIIALRNDKKSKFSFCVFRVFS